MLVDPETVQVRRMRMTKDLARRGRYVDRDPPLVQAKFTQLQDGCLTDAEVHWSFLVLAAVGHNDVIDLPLVLTIAIRSIDVVQSSLPAYVAALLRE